MLWVKEGFFSEPPVPCVDRGDRERWPQSTERERKQNRDRKKQAEKLLRYQVRYRDLDGPGLAWVLDGCLTLGRYPWSSGRWGY